MKTYLYVPLLKSHFLRMSARNTVYSKTTLHGQSGPGMSGSFLVHSAEHTPPYKHRRSFKYTTKREECLMQYKLQFINGPNFDALSST